MSPLVAGVDSSTQSCKVLIVDADDGRVVREGSAPHPDGTEVDPQHWWRALGEAVAQAGGLGDVAAIGVGGQQHGMVTLDAAGEVIRPALLWNDTRSGEAAAQVVAELGAQTWAQRVGVVPVASFTNTKLRWLADHEPDNAANLAAACLPHDWLTWKLRGDPSLTALTTDRSDASGTGYFDPVTNTYQRDLLAMALRRDDDAADVLLPAVIAPSGVAGALNAPELGATTGVPISAGCGDNAGAALGLGMTPGQVQISLGTSGVVAAVSATQIDDPSGTYAGFADATGAFLPLAATLNAARILTATADLLGVSLAELDELALSAPAGAGGLVQVPWFDGERTPNRPDATASLHGMTRANYTPANLARASVESLLCLMGAALAELAPLGVSVERVLLVGGGSNSAAVRALAPSILGVAVDLPPSAQYVALGAARQAGWALSGAAAPPIWPLADIETVTADPTPEILQRYLDLTARL